MAKLDIDFILIDDSVVMNGFRCIMSGAELDEFKRNPVMLYMHNRASASVFETPDTDVILPIGKWYDIRIEGNALKAKPDFDDNDDFAKKIESKVKGGYLNAASIWLDPIATDDDESMKKPGQKGPCVTKWGVKEGSIVDIPNCKNAIAIRNSAGKKIALSGTDSDGEILDYLKSLSTNTTMDRKLLCARLGLAETASDADIANKLAALNTDAATLLTVKGENEKLKTDLAAANQKLADRDNAEKLEKATALVDGAIASKKVLAGDKDKYVKLAAADFDTTKSLIDALPVNQSIESRLSDPSKLTTNDAELQELLKLSGRDLYMQGKFERLKEISPEYFKLKYKEYFGKEFTETK